MKEKIKCCPHCGSESVAIHDVSIDCFQVVCEKCGASGAIGQTREEALQFWNERFCNTKLLFKDECGIHDFAEWYKQKIITGLWNYTSYDEFMINKEAQELIQNAMDEPNDEGLRLISWDLEHSLLQHSKSLCDRVLEILNLKSYNEYLKERQEALEKLENCPFCGKNSLDIDVSKTDDGYKGVIKCYNCGANINSLKSYSTAQEAKEQAAFQWNKRSIKK